MFYSRYMSLSNIIIYHGRSGETFLTIYYCQTMIEVKSIRAFLIVSLVANYFSNTCVLPV